MLKHFRAIVFLLLIQASHTAKNLIDEPRMFQYIMDELDISFGRDMGRINWDLDSGFYLLIIKHGDQTSRRKIIIQ